MIKEKLLKLCLAPLRLLPIKENRIVFICNRGGVFVQPKYMRSTYMKTMAVNMKLYFLQ